MAFCAGLAVASVTIAPPYEKNDELFTAPVTMKEAAEIAETRVPGFANEAELVRKKNRMVWDVDVVTSNRVLFTMDIDAKTGQILNVEKED